MTATVNKKNYNLQTDENGVASLNLNLKPASYVLKVVFKGSENFTPLTKSFNVKVVKLPTSLTPQSCEVYYGKYFYVALKDKFGQSVSGASLTMKLNGKTYTAKTDSNGKAKLKISVPTAATYSMKISFTGNDYYGSVSKTITLTVPETTSIVIGNDKLLTGGYLRVYLKSSKFSAVSKQTLTITIGSKNYTKTTNSEGIVVFKPGLEAKNYTVRVTFEGTPTVKGSTALKDVMGVEGNVINPLKASIPFYNGHPDIDVMPANYVMGDENATYTLLKSQYRNVLKRDSQTLFIKNKLSKYVIFKTKTESKLIHILVREKWNVIERALNTKIVQKNKYNYWPSQISASLKGKSYTYAQVRDIQNTGYTCGPTSCSMCSQVLKNYVCEKQLAKLAKSNAYSGSTAKNLKKALEKCNFKCSIFYKSGFYNAIEKFKKGGYAIVFHTWGHFVSILDISKDGKKVLIGNPSGDYDTGSHGIPTKWVTVKFIYKKFNNYDTSSLLVKLKYTLSQSTKTQLKYAYNSFGAGWTAQNTNERIPNVGI